MRSTCSERGPKHLPRQEMKMEQMELRTTGLTIRVGELQSALLQLQLASKHIACMICPALAPSLALHRTAAAVPPSSTAASASTACTTPRCGAVPLCSLQGALPMGGHAFCNHAAPCSCPMAHALACRPRCEHWARRGVLMSRHLQSLPNSSSLWPTRVGEYGI